MTTRRPTSLRVSGYDYTVAYVAPSKMKDDEGGYAIGLHHAAKQRIEVATLQSPLDTRDTLLHELFHAILHRQGNEYGAVVEEHYVNSLATGLVGVFQDNPEFAKWLIQPLNK